MLYSGEDPEESLTIAFRIPFIWTEQDRLESVTDSLYLKMDT